MTVGTLERRILMLNPMHALHARSLSRMCVMLIVMQALHSWL